MKSSRRSEITTETHEVTVIRFGQKHVDAYCACCGRMTVHISKAQAADLLSLSLIDVDELLKAGRIHGASVAEVPTSCCGHSLLRLLLREG